MKSLRPLWIGLAALLIFTPLGLLAAGTAWGEWKPESFAHLDSRRGIASASLNVPPPAAPPAGLEHLSSVWTAPLPDYAPKFLKSASAGYLLSAMFGAGCILLTFLSADHLVQLARRPFR